MTRRVLYSPIGSFFTVSPGLENQLMSVGTCQRMSPFFLWLAHFYSLACSSLEELDPKEGTPGLRKLPSIADNAFASHDVSFVVARFVIGDMGVDPLHGSVDGILAIDAGR